MSRLFFSKFALRATAQSLPQGIALSRTFSSIPSLRPTLSNSSTVFRPSSCPLARLPLAPATSETGAAAEAVLDLVPKTAITAHPALGALQIRCGPRPNMNRNSRLIQKRRHGYLSRIRTAKGRKMLARRKAKGRKRLSA